MRIRARLAERWNPDDVLDSLWSIIASPYATMFLLLGLALCVFLGAVLPQRPEEAVSNPLTNGMWLTSVRERLHGATDWLLPLGLFDVHHSLWLRGMLGLLAFNLAVSAVDLARPRHAWYGGSRLGTKTLLGSAPDAETLRQLLEAVKETLRRCGYRSVEGTQGQHIYADRFVLFPILLCLGLLLAIGGLAVSERTAWWQEKVTVSPGQVRPLGHGTGLAMRADLVEASYDRARGRLHDGRTELTFLRQERQVGREVLFNHTPSLYGSLIFYQTTTEPALLVQGRDATGRNLSLQTPETGVTQFTEVALRFREEEGQRYIVVLGLTSGSRAGRYYQQKGNEQYVIVPSRDLSLRVIYSPPQPGEATSTFQVEAYRGTDTSPVYQHQLHGTESVEIVGDVYELRPQRYAIVKYGQDYGLVFILTGAALAFVGLILGAGHPPRRLRLVAQSSGDEVSLVVATAMGAHGQAPPWFESLAQSIAAGSALQVQNAS